MKTKKLLIATSNKGKFREYQVIFQELWPELEILSLRDFAISENPEESGTSFEENARLKAEFYFRRFNIPTLADDGGIEIEYLGGEPGVKSRRWPGYEASDEELVRMTLEKLAGVPFEKRAAELKAAIAFVPRMGTVYTFEGVWSGFIVEERNKKATLQPGYPYRSLFFIPETGKVLGELPFEEEVRIGHRRKALERALAVFKRELT